MTGAGQTAREVIGQVLPAAIGMRVRGAITKVVEHQALDMYEVTSKLTIVAHTRVSMELVARYGMDAVKRVHDEITEHLERHGADAFGALLTEREQSLREQLETMTERARVAEGYVDAIRDAWEIEGPAPEVHHKAQRDLRRSWPVLAHAVARISEHDRERSTRGRRP